MTLHFKIRAAQLHCVTVILFVPGERESYIRYSMNITSNHKNLFVSLGGCGESKRRRIHFFSLLLLLFGCLYIQ